MKHKYPEVSVAVLAQQCADSPDDGVTPEMCEAIAAVFTAGAAAIREGKRGSIVCWHEGELLAEVGVDIGGEFNDETGLPVIQEIKLAQT